MTLDNMNMIQIIMTKILLLSLKEIALLWLILILIIIFTKNFRKRKNEKLLLEKLKNSREFFRAYIDQYYITSKLKTFSFCFLYMCGTSLIFIGLRYTYLGNTTQLNYITTESSTALLTYIQVIITFILYKILLDKLFANEANKLYLFLETVSLGESCRYLLGCKIVESILGYLIVACDDFISKYVDNKNIQRTRYCLKVLFTALSFVLHFLYVHIKGFSTQLPYFILSLIFFVELYNKEFKYIYIASFICILIVTKRRLEYFIRTRNRNLDKTIAEYFYNNDVSYAKQRLSFFYDEKILIIVNPLNTQQNQDLILKHSALVDYIFNNFQIPNDSSNQKQQEGLYRRFFIVCSSMFLLSFTLTSKILVYKTEGFVFCMVLLLLLLCVLIYTSYQVYYSQNTTVYNSIFWITTLIQSYLFWILLLKPELFFPETEVLWNNVFTIIKVYTYEEKVMYLFQYFEYRIAGLTANEQELLRCILRMVAFDTIIDETTTLKDIIYYVKGFIQTQYYYSTIMIMDHIISEVEILEDGPNLRAKLYNILKYLIAFGGLAGGVDGLRYHIYLVDVLYHEGPRAALRSELTFKYRRFIKELYKEYIKSVYPSPPLVYGEDRIKQTVEFFFYNMRKYGFYGILDIFTYYGVDVIPLQLKIIFVGISSAIIGTFILPDIVQYFKQSTTEEITPIPIEDLITFLDNMSTVPIIAPNNPIYCLGILLVFIVFTVLTLYYRKSHTFKRRLYNLNG